MKFPLIPPACDSPEMKPYVMSITLQSGLRYIGMISGENEESGDITLIHVICMGSEARESAFGAVSVQMHIAETMDFSRKDLVRVDCFDASSAIFQESFAGIGRRFNPGSGPYPM